MRTSWLLIPMLLLASVACEGAGDEVLYSVGDSLGIQVVTVDARHQSGAFSVDAEPEWVIGYEDDVTFHGVEDAVLLGNGKLAVADRSQQQVIVIHPESGEVERWGGPGDGPEEFRGLARVFDLGGERVGAYDRLRARFVVLEDGTFQEVTSLPRIAETQDPPLLELLPAQGWDVMYLAARAGLPGSPEEGAHRGSGPVVRLHSSGQVDTITTIPGNTTFVAQGAAGAVPFGATTLLAAGRDGLWIGDTAHEEVSLFRESSQPLTVARWVADGSRELTEERVAALWDALEADVPEEQRAMVGQLREATPVPATVPAFGAIHTSPSGALWIGSAVPPEVQMLQVPPPSQDWLVIDFEREEVARGTTPEGFRLLQVTGDQVVGVQVDALGVEAIAAYRLLWQNGS